MTTNNCNCACCLNNRNIMHLKFKESSQEFPDLYYEVQLLRELAESIADGSVSSVLAPMLSQKVLEKIKLSSWEN
jgi:hypothetical protein